MGIFQSAKCLYFAGIGQMVFAEVSEDVLLRYSFSTLQITRTESNLLVQKVLERISTLADK